MSQSSLFQRVFVFWWNSLCLSVFQNKHFFYLFSHGFLQHFCIWKQKFKSETEKNCIVPIILCKNNQIFCNQLQNVWNCFVVFCKNQLSFTKILKWFDSVKLLKLFVKSHKIFEKWCQNLVIILQYFAKSYSFQK